MILINKTIYNSFMNFSFSEIGLTNRDKRVYEALLQNQQSSLRKIAEITSINRGSVYESIKQLVQVGLVGTIENGKRSYYIASDPAMVIEILKERQRKAKLAEISAQQYISNVLPKKQDLNEDIPFATFYQDNVGIAAILRDVIATTKTLDTKFYRVISTKRVRGYLYHNFASFNRRRIEEKIMVNVIAVGSGGKVHDLSERKWLESNRQQGPNCYTLIYGNKTAFISIDDTNCLSGIVIDNSGVTNLQKELFDHMWDIL